MRFNNWKMFTNLDLLENSKEFEEIIKSLNEDGGHMWKVRSPSKFFRRKFSLDLKDLSMKYEPSSKSPCFAKTKQFIELGEIVEIRQGWKTDTFNKLEASETRKKTKKPGYKGKVDEKACFSIIYGPRRDTWDLVGTSGDVTAKWVRTLNHLLSLYRAKEEKQGYERWLRKQFNSADVDKNKCLSFSETMRLLKQLNIDMEENDAKKLFEAANITKNSKQGGEEVLDEDEFVLLYYKLLRRPDFERLFDSLVGSSGSQSANASAVCEFLKREQGEDFASCTEEDCAQMIKIYEPSAELKSKGELSVSGFLNMLLSPHFDLFNAKHKGIHQDMTLPLAQYYIACSHNTYLLGHQLSGISSVEGYIDALKRGCRFLELDCWDGEEEEPIITHGFTLTTKILFKEVITDAIKPYAFISSRYPVFLSLENHCSEPFQIKMAEHLKTILGDMIYTTPTDESLQFLPSPEELQGKIIIRAKKKSPKAPVQKSNTVPDPQPLAEENEDLSSCEKEIDSLPEGDSLTGNSIPGVDDGFLIPKSPSWTSPPKASMESLDDDSEESDQDEAIDYIDGNSGSKKQGVSYDLSSLINLSEGVHFHSFEDSKEHHKCYHSVSLGEAKATKLIVSNGPAFVEYNKNHLTKIYPGGSRTNSSNFNPIPYWNIGCQLVAMNYQTEDVPNFLNHSLFLNNGQCGYVLKPDFLRDPGIKYDPQAKFPEDRGITLKVKIISGQHIPKAPGVSEVVDPYVEVKVLGHEQDRAKVKTKVVHNNGFNPIWGETFKFRIYCPELAFLNFRVKDYSQTGTDLHLAHFALPMSSITTGYRHVHLLSLKGVPMVPSSLFVHVTVQQHGAGAMNGSSVQHKN